MINASFGSSGASQAEMDAIQQAGRAGIVFVCAAGNSAENIDISPFFPADYPLDNIITVGATDNRDLAVYFSNYGSGSMEIFAPGENILSTYFSGNSSYEYLSGTSMAAPMVAGAVALLKQKYPTDTYRETINRILNSADRNPGLIGKSQSGGRLNLETAVTSAPNTPPNDVYAGRTVLTGLDPYTRSNNADSPPALEPGTPAISGTPGGHSLWWEWTAPENATVEIDTSGTNGGQYITGGSTYPTLLGVYTGAGLANLTLVQASNNNLSEPLEGGGGNVTYSLVSFHASAGTTYEINVQGAGSASGQTVLAINTAPDNDSFSGARVLSGASLSLLDANPNATRQAGEPAIRGGEGGHSLWYSWTAAKAGPVQVSGYSYDFNPAVAVYTGSAISALTAVASAAGTGDTGTSTDIFECLCSFQAVAGTTYLIAVDGVTSSDVGEFTLSIADSRWQATTGDSVTGAAAVGPDGTIYIGSDDNSLYAFNQDGSLRWSHASGAPFDTSAPAIGPDGTVYAGSEDGKLYAFSAAGTLAWTYSLPTAASGNGISCSPALASDGTVYFHGDDGNLYALNPTGTLKWTASVPGVSYAAPTIAPDGTIYIGSDSGDFYAFTPGGVQKWSYPTPVAGDSIYTAAAIDAAGNVYFGTLGGFFYSLGPTGSPRWSYAVGDGVTSAPALANGSVYFGGYDSNLYALSAASGALQWKFAVGAQVRASAPAVDAGGNVYIGSYDHNVYEVAAGGTLVRTFAADDWVRSSPVISGTTLYFGSNDHKLYAFDIATSPAASDWPMYQFNDRRVGRAVSSAFAITAQPASQAIAPGGNLTLYVGATSSAPVSYQWSLNGAPITGAVNSTYSVFSASASTAGSYSVTVTSGAATIVSTAAVVTVGTPPVTGPGTGTSPPAGRIVNLSARANVGTGGNILIAGFVVSGSGSKNLVLRGIGPTLALAPYNVSGVLAEPELTLISSATNASIATATAWGGSPALSSAFSAVARSRWPATRRTRRCSRPFPSVPTHPRSPGSTRRRGVALAEIYDADASSSPSSPHQHLGARQRRRGRRRPHRGVCRPGNGAGPGAASRHRPTLGTAPYNVAGVLPSPEIDLFNAAGTKIGTNTGWNTDPHAGGRVREGGCVRPAAGLPRRGHDCDPGRGQLHPPAERPERDLGRGACRGLRDPAIAARPPHFAVETWSVSSPTRSASISAGVSVRGSGPAPPGPRTRAATAARSGAFALRPNCR